MINTQVTEVEEESLRPLNFINKFLIIEEMRTGKLVKLKYDCFIGCCTNLWDLCLMNW